MQTTKEMQAKWVSEIDTRIAECREEINQLETLKMNLMGKAAPMQKSQRKPSRRRRSKPPKSKSNGSAESREKVMAVLTPEPMTRNQIAKLAGLSEGTAGTVLAALAADGKAKCEKAERKPGQSGILPMVYSAAVSHADGSDSQDPMAGIPPNRFRRNESDTPRVSIA